MMGHPTLIRGRLLVIGAILTGGSSLSHAQDVLASAGASFSNAMYSIAFTVGEPVIVTHAQAGVIATQGFHQPPDDFSTAVAAVMDPAAQVLAFPNPAREEVTVVVDGVDRPLILEVFDATGRSIRTSAAFTGRVTLDVRSIASGTYHLRLTAGGQYLSTVHLIIAH